MKVDLYRYVTTRCKTGTLQNVLLSSFLFLAVHSPQDLFFRTSTSEKKPTEPFGPPTPSLYTFSEDRGTGLTIPLLFLYLSVPPTLTLKPLISLPQSQSRMGLTPRDPFPCLQISFHHYSKRHGTYRLFRHSQSSEVSLFSSSYTHTWIHIHTHVYTCTYTHTHMYLSFSLFRFSIFPLSP